MSLTRLQEDLLNDFRQQKQTILEQIELFDPLATSLRKPAAQRLASKTGLIIAETFCYLLSLAAFAFSIFMNLIYPFTSLINVRYIKNINDLTAMKEAEYFSIAVHCIAAFTGILFFIMARMTRRIRLKNNILSLAGKNMKELVGQHLKRKAAIESIEQRHFDELPFLGEPAGVNAVPNPGFDYSE
jgi:hypothetical protein